MADKVYPAFAFIGFVLVLIPLPWHLHAWNAGTCLFMIWTAIGCFIHFVNSIVWAGNLEIHSAPWCDISTKLIVGLSVALPCASLCINRRLYSIARVSQVHTTKAEKRRGVYIDIAIGFGIPVIIMALHYIVQGHRFDIFEDIGCWPSTVNMALVYPLVWMWPVIIGLISMVFCFLSLNAFLRRRAEFNELLVTNPNLNMNRYFRLMALATIEICTTTPFAVYFMYLDITTVPISPWVSWSDTKWHFSRIDTVPAWFVNAKPALKLNFSLNLWLFPGCAILFFAFFGFAEEARRNYKKFYYFLVKPFGITPSAHSGVKRGGQNVTITLPSPHTSSIDNASVRGAKWDELSLKMPEISEDPVLPSSTDVTAVTVTRFPTAKSRRSSLNSSEASSFTTHGHSTPSSPVDPRDFPSSRLPTMSVTHPENEVSPVAQVQSSTPFIHHPPPAMRRVPSASFASRPSSHRESTSSDYGIIVSPVYLSGTSTPSRYHEEELLGRDTFGVSQPAHSQAQHPHGGVRMTVEKSVV